MSALIEVFDDLPYDGQMIEDCSEGTYEAMIAASFARLNSLELESELILQGKDAGLFVMEDVEIGVNKDGPSNEKNLKGVFAHVKEFLSKIIKFLKDALNNFIEGISNSISSADEWFAENAKYLDNIPDEVYANMRISVIPYWDLTRNYRNLLSQGIPMRGGTLDNIMNDIQKKTNLTPEEVFSTYFPDFSKLDQDVRRAAFSYYEGPPAGTENILPAEKEFTGANCAGAINAMKLFFTNYYKNCFNATQAAIKKNTNDMDKISKNFDRQGVSMASEESTFVFDSDLYSDVAECKLNHIASVEDKYGNPARKAFLDVAIENNGNVSSGQVTGTNTGNNPPPQQQQNPNPNQNGQQQQQQTQTKGQKNAGAPKQNGTRKPATAPKDIKYREINKVYQTCATIASARMTALGNIADHYANTLQQLVAGIKKYRGIKDEEQENDNYNRKQDEREEREHKEQLTEIRRNRQKRIAAKQGFFTRLGARLFGK